MTTRTQKNASYSAPETCLLRIHLDNIICQSPGGGGSEGTGSEELEPFFPTEFDSFDSIEGIL